MSKRIISRGAARRGAALHCQIVRRLAGQQISDAARRRTVCVARVARQSALTNIDASQCVRVASAARTRLNWTDGPSTIAESNHPISATRRLHAASLCTLYRTYRPTAVGLIRVCMCVCVCVCVCVLFITTRNSTRIDATSRPSAWHDEFLVLFWTVMSCRLRSRQFVSSY